MIYLKMLGFAAIAALSGCATSAEPNLFNGRYYWAGDNACQMMHQVGSSRILCVDGQGNKTGFRDAMSSDELQVYMFNLAQSRARNQQISQEIAAMNQQMQMTQMPQMQMPQIGPYYSSGSNQVRCITAGIYTNCRY